MLLFSVVLMAILYLVVDGVIYGPIQSLNTLPEVKQYVMSFILKASVSAKEGHTVIEKDIYLRCLTTDVIIKTVVTEDDSSSIVPSGVYQVYLHEHQQNLEDSDPKSYVSVSRQVQANLSNNNPIDRIRKAFSEFPRSSTFSSKDIKYESMSHMIHVIRMAIPILDEISHVLGGDESHMGRRPKTWRKRISTVADPRFQPDVRNKVTRKHIVEVLLLITGELLRAKSLVDQKSPFGGDKDEANEDVLLKVLMQFSRIWEKEIEVSPYQIYFNETLYNDIIPRARENRDFNSDTVHLMKQLEDLKLKARQKPAYNKIKEAEYRNFYENLEDNLLNSMKGKCSRHDGVASGAKGKQLCYSSSPYRPIDPEYAFRQCKKRVLQTMITSHVVHDQDMRLLFEACLSLEAEILGPFGTYPTVYVRERLATEFNVLQ